jgi:hypothetical protein
VRLQTCVLLEFKSHEKRLVAAPKETAAMHLPPQNTLEIQRLRQQLDRAASSIHPRRPEQLDCAHLQFLQAQTEMGISA